MPYRATTLYFFERAGLARAGRGQHARLAASTIDLDGGHFGHRRDDPDAGHAGSMSAH
jgi:hypothetical protein